MPIDLQGSGMTSSRTRDRMVNRLIEQGINDINVIEVMRATPRHIFLDEALAHRAYEDTALPIGHGQTLSQPYIVARMTEALLADGPLERVLEIGAGSGDHAGASRNDGIGEAGNGQNDSEGSGSEAGEVVRAEHGLGSFGSRGW